MSLPGNRTPYPVLLWIARIVGTAVLVFLLLFTVGSLVNPGDSVPSGVEWVGLALFPAGLCVGYAVAWRWQLAGGLVSLGCMVLFLVTLVVFQDDELEPIFLNFSIPALLFILYGILASRTRNTAVSE
jgi:hypothetical protein